jgi:hypothetical protein
MITTYEGIKKRYETVAPIRGREVDVRPIGQRRRDWELVVKIDHAGGEPSYAAQLYQTNVVEYLPNGNIILRHGGWGTPKTADFMTDYSPFKVSKRANLLWVVTNNKYYPLDKNGVEFRGVDGAWEPVDTIVMQQRVVDRDKAKALRAQSKEFRDWLKAFLLVSDGWVMHETCKEVLGFTKEGGASGYKQLRIRESELVPMFASDDPDVWLKALCSLAAFHLHHGAEKRVAEKVPYEFEWSGQKRTHEKTFYDVKLGVVETMRAVKRISDKFGDMYKVREVHPADRPIYNVV